MSEARVERRLAAILAVDVAGYSRLMGEDEEGTLAALRAVRRELGDPKIAASRRSTRSPLIWLRFRRKFAIQSRIEPAGTRAFSFSDAHQ